MNARSAARTAWLLLLRTEFRAIAVLLPVIIIMLSVAIAILERAVWWAWVGSPGAAWLGIQAWGLAKEIGQ